MCGYVTKRSLTVTNCTAGSSNTWNLANTLKDPKSPISAFTTESDIRELGNFLSTKLQIARTALWDSVCLITIVYFEIGSLKQIYIQKKVLSLRMKNLRTWTKDFSKEPKQPCVPWLLSGILCHQTTPGLCEGSLSARDSSASWAKGLRLKMNLELWAFSCLPTAAHPLSPASSRDSSLCSSLLHTGMGKHRHWQLRRELCLIFLILLPCTYPLPIRGKYSRASRSRIVFSWLTWHQLGYLPLSCTSSSVFHEHLSMFHLVEVGLCPAL